MAFFYPKLRTLLYTIRSKYYINLEDETISYKRKQAHYKDCLTSRSFFKETRCLGAEKFFLKKYKEVVIIIQNLKFKTELKSGITKIIASFVTLLGLLGVFTLLVVLIIKGEIRLAVFSAVIYALMDMYNLMEEIFESRLGELTESAGAIKSYFTYLDLPEERMNGGVCVDKVESINFTNVNFAYPKAKNYVLQDINLIITKNKTTVVVGENGSGKTTLSKLLLGLYKPSAGIITINGINIYSINKNNLLSNFSSVFQDHCNYKMNVTDNIAIADFSKWNKQHNSDEIIKAIKNSDFRINGIQNAAETLKHELGKEFGGLDISGGEWQRLSTARSVFKNACVLILDEPTSAIDPAEETTVLKRFLTFTKNRTCVIISHRMGLCKFADNIIVLKDGKIIEVGTHLYLIKKDGEYRRLYNSQAEFY